MPEAISTPNLIALPITSQELGRWASPPPTKIGQSNSPATIGLKTSNIEMQSLSTKKDDVLT